MIFLSYGPSEPLSIKNAIREYQGYRAYLEEYKQYGTILRSLLKKYFPTVLAYSPTSSQFYEYADSVLTNNPQYIPNNLALMFMLGQNGLFTGKYFGLSNEKLFNRVESKKVVTNGYVEYPAWITGIMPNPSISTTPSEKEVVTLLEKELIEYEKAFNEYLLKNDTRSYKVIKEMMNEFGINTPIEKASPTDPINKYKRMRSNIFENSFPQINTANGLDSYFPHCYNVKLSKLNIENPNLSNANSVYTSLPNGNSYNKKTMNLTLLDYEIQAFCPWTYEYSYSNVKLEPWMDKTSPKFQYGQEQFLYSAIFRASNDGEESRISTYYVRPTMKMKNQIVEFLTNLTGTQCFIIPDTVSNNMNLRIGMGYADASLPNKENYPVAELLVKIPNDRIFVNFISIKDFFTFKGSEEFYKFTYLPNNFTTYSNMSITDNFINDYFDLNKTRNPKYFEILKTVSAETLSEMFMSNYQIFSSEKEKDIFGYFLRGEVSLDFLKNIVIPDKIIKSEVDVDTPQFPLFLKKIAKFTPYTFDDSYLLVDIDSIRPYLVKVVNFIEVSLFAQDIHTLNKLSDQVSKSIVINTDAIAMLQAERNRLDRLDAEFQATLVNAKKLQTVYDMLSSQMINKIDPVIQSQLELDQEIASEMKALETQYALRAQQALVTKEAQIEAEKNALVEAQKASTSEIVQIATEAQTQKANENPLTPSESLYQTNDMVKPLNKPTLETKPKTNITLPLILGAGVVAFLTLGNKEG